MATYILTVSRKQSSSIEPQTTENVETIRSGGTVPDAWDVHGSLVEGGIVPGDRGYLLVQGTDERGIVASATFTEEPEYGPSWRESDEGALAERRFARLLWDAIVDMDQRLPIEDLVRELPEKFVSPRQSGTRLGEANARRLEELWSEHLRGLTMGSSTEAPAPTPPTSGQGFQQDAALRREIEDLAQQRLTDHFVAQGWEVADRRVGHPYDAIAMRDGEVCYLEAKGTTSSGESVLVTRNEVAFAAANPRQCVMGIVANIEVVDGHVVPHSGDLVIYDWFGEEEDLEAMQYAYHPHPRDRRS
ncbi:DUF3883 domain-containing protein [Flavimobilis sp. GY10621]|uniref:DUF3883 domain-containing protein n=1 Tax=Flavimobilis rhizosphaerae TaxID=2775421 RepID=A0ABR9DRD8_9MICO|nr:DUF3883 domain-containing protein [Flavimobilis rhizosphaerae]MBD9699553.1 DUF3883 domain-containing protein [Flavimobilis rhizosphaerae]